MKKKTRLSKLTKKNKTRKNKTRKTIPKSININYRFYKKKPELINIHGYNILLLPVDNSRLTLVECAVFGGSYLENKKTSGYAHLLEHILMGSWKKCKKQKCSLYLEKYGISSNAYATSTHTKYWMQGLTNVVDVIIDYMFSIMLNPKIHSKLLNHEKKIIDTELKNVINTPTWELYKELGHIFYKAEGLKYSNDPLHQLSILDKVSIKAIMQFYKQTFCKQSMLFTISGHYDKTTILKKIERHIISNTKQRNSDCIVNTNIAHKDCYSRISKTIYVKNTSVKNTTISINYPLSIYNSDKYFPYLGFIAKIIAGDLNSLLMKQLRLRDKLVYSIKAVIDSDFCSSYLNINMTTHDNKIKYVIDKTKQILHEYSNKSISTNHLNNIKRLSKQALYSMCLSTPKSVSDFYTAQFFFQLNKKNKTIFSLADVYNNINSLNKSLIKKIIKYIIQQPCLIGYSGRTKI
tara:strand:+ start:549 stop:1937 length:1389 start_codon:yes stop_codon:yes gene_type:complete